MIGESDRPLALLICGDRNWTNYDKIRKLVGDMWPELVIEGEARGADLLGRQAAESYEILVEPHPADWDTLGRKAGPIRNEEQAKRLVELREQGWQVACAAFHSDLDSSKGTADMVRRCERYEIEVIRIT